MASVRPIDIDNRKIREVERASIEAYVQACAIEGIFEGRVLDFGCGQQPYRHIVEQGGGEYFGFDRADFPANVSGADVGDDILITGRRWADAILCNQVAQYWPDPLTTLKGLRELLVDGGHLVMTYPTTWAEVEPQDLWRYTSAGMAHLLERADLHVVHHEARYWVDLSGFELVFGYGVVAVTPTVERAPS